MYKRQKKAVILRSYELTHYNCVQAVLSAFSDKIDIPERDLFRISQNLGRGLKQGSTCGVIVGGLLVLGFLNITEGRYVSKVWSLFRERFDGTDCADLIKDTPRDCNNYICAMIRRLHEIILDVEKQQEQRKLAA